MGRYGWLIPCGIYWIYPWVAGKRKGTVDAARCFLDGFFLAFLCFGVLPYAMEGRYFYGAAVCSALGALAGVRLEKRKKTADVATAALFTGLSAFYFGQAGGRNEGMGFALLLAFFGGMGLYFACAGILPEDIPLRKQLLLAVLGGGGFLLGTLCFGSFF